ncbi:curli-like amyloid fiber formation chaperone CsgH [Cohaesibacter haloalkalitolerans]|uniref:curli-like amyloid fiber formation chaperone CsgH n=1 Tax=Cohaesibacter haloalkalitolerans TaxID=1162980 RepID=UPI0013C42016|nr:curli-like amyloid fiber formation chaperone CsgH [Cohaesibacter haloalkalitolerans]
MALRHPVSQKTIPTGHGRRLGPAMRLSLLLGLAVTPSMGTPTMAADQKAEPRLVFETNGDQLTISGVLHPAAPGDYVAKLEVIKSGPNGKATTRQSNRIMVNGDKTYPSSKVSLRLSTGDHVTARLDLFSNDKLLQSTHREFDFGTSAPEDKNHL